MKFFCSVEYFLPIHLNLKMNNLKLNSIVNSLSFISLQINSLLASLFVIRKIKIASLIIRFISFCSESSRTVSFDTRTVIQTLLSLFANSIKSLLIQSADCGIYFLVFLIQEVFSKHFLKFLVHASREHLLEKCWRYSSVKESFSKLFSLWDSMKNIDACIIKFMCYN